MYRCKCRNPRNFVITGNTGSVSSWSSHFYSWQGPFDINLCTPEMGHARCRCISISYSDRKRSPVETLTRSRLRQLMQLWTANGTNFPRKNPSTDLMIHNRIRFWGEKHVAIEINNCVRSAFQKKINGIAHGVCWKHSSYSCLLLLLRLLGNWKPKTRSRSRFEWSKKPFFAVHCPQRKPTLNAKTGRAHTHTYILTTYLLFEILFSF